MWNNIFLQRVSFWRKSVLKIKNFQIDFLDNRTSCEKSLFLTFEFIFHEEFKNSENLILSTFFVNVQFCVCVKSERVLGDLG